MKNHEQTIESHVDGNVASAIENADELESPFDSYMQNAIDSVLEDGYTTDEAMDAGDWFCVKFRKKTGLAV